MSAPGTVLIAWAGGEHEFCISKVGHILALERTCDAGLGVISARLETGQWRLNDIRETIRLGLIGAGMSPTDAMSLVQNFVDAGPLKHYVLVAYAILQAHIVGSIPEDDPVGKRKPGEAVAAPGSSTTTAGTDALN